MIAEDELLWNFETVYASITGIAFVLMGAWYLIFIRPDVLPGLYHRFRSWLPIAHANVRADWGRANVYLSKRNKERTCMIDRDNERTCMIEGEQKKRTCMNCGTTFNNGVIVAGCDYCTGCAMSPEVLEKAREQMTNGYVDNG